MMKIKFGVNSATPINKKLKNDYTMYDWVKRQNAFLIEVEDVYAKDDKVLENMW